MVKLYGGEIASRHRREQWLFAQFAGVRLMVLEDGLERGVRMLEFRSGTGLRFTVLVDRALDIADCDYRGMAIGWHSPSGFRHPGLHEYEGEGGLGWMRSFSGLMVTCGLDHILFMYDEVADHYNYKPRQTIKHSIHGRVGTIPAKLTGYGERWEGDECYLWCEGIVTQGTVFGEHLELTRRIEIKAGTNDIKLTDRVTNRGFIARRICIVITLMSASRFGRRLTLSGTCQGCGLGGSCRRRLQKQSVGYRTLPAPQMKFHEQVWQHDMGADANGEVSVALVNDKLGIGFEVVTRKDQFPCMYEWQNLQAGQYALGIEPATNHVLGHGAARDRGELIWLEHGEERRYDSTFRILGDAASIAETETRIAAIAKQPIEEYPVPSGNHIAIGGRS